MLFENISIHCENENIVEICETTPLLRHLLDEVLMLILMIRYVTFYVY